MFLLVFFLFFLKNYFLRDFMGLGGVCGTTTQFSLIRPAQRILGILRHLLDLPSSGGAGEAPWISIVAGPCRLPPQSRFIFSSLRDSRVILRYFRYF